MEQSVKKLSYIRMCIFCSIYSLFYTFCLYKNYRGVTFPFFVAGTLCFFVYYMKSQGRTLKRFSGFIIVSILALGINICLTVSPVLSAFDRGFIFVLFFILFLYNLYDDETWDVPRYAAAIVSTVCTTIRYILDPIADGVKCFRENKEPADTKKPGNLRFVILGLVLSLPILLVVLPLLISSDAVFSRVMEKIFTFGFDFNEDIFGITGMLIALFFISYALYKRLMNRSVFLETPVADKRTKNPVVAITISAVLLIFYGIYCLIQIIYLFMGYGKLPAGYTYAEYVHEGFYQLVFVCIINLILVLLCRKYSRDSIVLKIMLCLISLCTFIMIFSSAYRMFLYVDAYGLTFLRLYVLWALMVIGLCMTGTMVYIFVPGMPFCKYSIVVLAAMWILFVYIRPDYQIAKYNLTCQDKCDEWYIINNLSGDAAPAVDKYSDDTELKRSFLRCKLSQNDYRYRGWDEETVFSYPEMTFRTFNLSGYLVSEMGVKYGVILPNS